MKKASQSQFFRKADLIKYKLENPNFSYHYKITNRFFKVEKDFETFLNKFVHLTKREHYLEYILDSQKVKGYFDIEYYGDEKNLEPYKYSLDFIKCIYNIYFNINLEEKDILVLCGSRYINLGSIQTYKHSFHIIINNGVCFLNNTEQKNFIDCVVNECESKSNDYQKLYELYDKMMVYDSIDSKYKSPVDFAPYSRASQSWRMPLTHKGDGDTRTLLSPLDDSVELKHYFVSYVDDCDKHYSDEKIVLPKLKIQKPITEKSIAKNSIGEITINEDIKLSQQKIDQVMTIIRDRFPEAELDSIIHKYDNIFCFNFKKSNYPCLICSHRKTTPHKHNSFYFIYNITNDKLYYKCRDADAGKKRVLLTPKGDGCIIWNEIYNSDGCRSPPIYDINTNNTVFIQANMGSGKTKMSINYLSNYPKASILIISYRVLLIKEYEKNFKSLGFISYQDLKDAQDYHRVICCYDSLNHLERQKDKYDIVLLDEIDSVLAHSSSEIMNKRGINQALFKRYVSTSNLVICMDAYLNNKRCVEIMKKLRPQIPIYSSYNSFVRETNRYVKLWTSKKNMDNEVARFRDELISCIEKDNQKIVCCSMSKTFVDECCNVLEEKGIGYYSYSSSTNRKIINEHTKDIRKAWRNSSIRAIFYTPTISSGISMENDVYEDGKIIDSLDGMEKVDKLFAFAMPNQRRTCSVWDFLQMLFRVRQLEDGEMNIMLSYDNSNTTDIPLSIAEIEKHIDIRSQDLISVFGEPDVPCDWCDKIGKVVYDKNNWKYLLFLHNTLRKAQSLVYFEDVLVEFFENLHIEVKRVDKKQMTEEALETKALVKELKEIKEEEYRQAYLEADILTYEEFEEIDMKKKKYEALTDDEALQYIKYKALEMFDLNGKALHGADEETQQKIYDMYLSRKGTFRFHKYQRYKKFITYDEAEIKTNLFNNIQSKHIEDDVFGVLDKITRGDDKILLMNEIFKKIGISSSDYETIENIQEEAVKINKSQLEDIYEWGKEFVKKNYNVVKQDGKIREKKKDIDEKFSVNKWVNCVSKLAEEFLDIKFEKVLDKPKGKLIGFLTYPNYKLITQEVGKKHRKKLFMELDAYAFDSSDDELDY